MTFVEAAIQLLEAAGAPMTVEELAERAVEEGLLTKPGKSPLSSMKSGLTRENKKGDAARVVRVEDGMLLLRYFNNKRFTENKEERQVN